MVAEYHRLRKHPLKLTHYSFLEDFERNINFAIKLPICSMDELSIRERLKRSRKRVYEHCKGFLEVVEHRYDKGTVPSGGQHIKFIHRSINEFLEEESVRQAMDSYVDGFDIIDFRRQSFVAELKSLQLTEAYFTQKIGGYSSRFAYDLRRYLIDDCHPDGASPRLCITLNQLVDVVIERADENITASWQIVRQSSLQYSKTDGKNYETNVIICHPSMQVRLCAIQYGMYQFLSTNMAPGLKLSPDPELDEFLGVALFSQEVFPERVGMLGNRLAKALAYGFENGVSVYSSGGFKESTSCWRTVLFYSVLGYRFISLQKRASTCEPILRAFLLYGAESHFWLQFGPRYCGNKSSTEIVRVVMQFGNNKEEPFDAFYVLDHPFSRSKEIIDLAETKGGAISFEDMVEFWFPERGRVLKELIRRNISRGVPNQNELNKLKAMPGWDLDIWKGITYETDRALFLEFIQEPQLEKNGFSVSEIPNSLYDGRDMMPFQEPLIDDFEETLRMRDESFEDNPKFYQGYDCY